MGPNAQQEPFNFGVSSGSNCYACSANPNTAVANYTPTAVPYHQFNLFNYTSYKITPDITASVMLNYGWDAEENIANDGRVSQAAIKVDNAFIPSQLQQQLIASGVSSFSLGTDAIENLQNTSQVSMRNLVQAIGQNYRPKLPPVDARRLHPEWRLQAVRRGLVVERLCPEQRRARAAMGAPQHHEHELQQCHRRGGGSAHRPELAGRRQSGDRNGGQECADRFRRANSRGRQYRLPFDPDPDPVWCHHQLGGLPDAPAGRWRRAACRWTCSATAPSARRRSTISPPAVKTMGSQTRRFTASASRCSRSRPRVCCPGDWRPESPLSPSALRIVWNSRPISVTRCNWAPPVCSNGQFLPVSRRI